MNTKEVKLTSELIEALNEELAYQTSIADSDRADSLDNGVAGQIVTLNVYTQHANAAWALNKGNELALHDLRKCAAIAIRALALYGCPRRPPVTK